jgi:hypothetical protein
LYVGMPRKLRIEYPGAMSVAGLEENTMHAPMKASRTDWWLGSLFLLGVCGYLALLMTVGRFPFVDEIYYKAAGREWAVSGHFRSPECAGFIEVALEYAGYSAAESKAAAADHANVPVDEVFATYPPLYPFLFGLFVKTFGFSWRTSLLYDGLLHVWLCCITIWGARRIAPEGARWRAYLAGLAVLPLGTVGRPDELAMCFGMAACGLALAPMLTLPRCIISGALLGLCCGTSMGAALGFACVWAGLRVPVLFSAQWRGALAATALAALSGICALAACLLPIAITHPHAYTFFIGEVKITAAALPLVASWLVAARHQGPFFAELIGVMLSAVLLALVLRGQSRTDGLRILLGAVFCPCLMVYLVRGKYPYLWFTLPWLLAGVMSVAGAARFGAGLWARRIATAIVLVGIPLGAIPYVDSIAILLKLPREQSLGYNVEHLRSIIPPGAVAMGDVAWMALLGRNLVYDPVFSSPRNIEHVDYVLVTSNGTGLPAVRRPLTSDQEEYLSRHFRVLESRFATTPLVLLGRRLSHNAYGFGTIVYVRQDQPFTRAALSTGGCAKGKFLSVIP